MLLPALGALMLVAAIAVVAYLVIATSQLGAAEAASYAVVHRALARLCRGPEVGSTDTEAADATGRGGANTTKTGTPPQASTTRPKPRVTALITGGNAGIGFALADALVAAGARVILACRSTGRGEAAVAELRARHIARITPSASVAAEVADVADRVRMLHVDVSDFASVRRAANAFREEEFGSSLDLLFCNAGIAPDDGNTFGILAQLACSSPAAWRAFFETGRYNNTSPHFLRQPAGLLVAGGTLAELEAQAAMEGESNARTQGRARAASPGPTGATDATVPGTTQLKQQPVGLLFATHVLGHHLLIRELRPQLEASTAFGAGQGGGRVIWTGSRSASRSAFSWGDPQHLRGIDSYGSAKFATDMLNRGLNLRQRERDAKLHTSRGRGGGSGPGRPAAPAPRVVHMSCCPGYVSTNVAPAFFNYFAVVTKYMRCIAPSMNLTTERGCIVHQHLATVDLSTIDYATRKWVVMRGKLEPAAAGRGWEPVADDEAMRMVELCDQLVDQ